MFWERYQELNDWEKIIKNIERGEQKIQRQADIMAAITTKLDKYKNPWQELKVGGGVGKGEGGGGGSWCDLCDMWRVHLLSSPSTWLAPVP